MKRISSLEILHFAKHFFYGTTLSRVSGMLRDMSLAYFFGNSPLIAAFMLAYRFAYLFRRLVGESSLQPTVIPHFEVLKAQDPKKAALFFRDLWASLLVFLLGICLFSQIFLSLPWSHRGEVLEMLGFAKILVIGLIFICLYALESAMLFCQKKYFLPSVAPVLFNLVWIGCIAAASFFQNLQLLAWGVVIALAMQWMVTFPKNLLYFLKHLSPQEWLSFRLFSAEIRKMFKPISYVLLGIGALQINSALDGLFARVSDISGPAYLWYAIRFQQLPIALFGISLASALLPSLSRAVQYKNPEEYTNLLQTAIRSSALLLLPATCALFSLGGSLLNLVYGRGGFSSEATLKTLYCLWGYSFAVFPMALVLLVSNGYYAQKKYAFPVKASLFSIGCNILLNALFIFGFGWGAYSVAFATSLSCFLQCGYLCWPIREVFQKDMQVLLTKILGLSLLAGICTVFVANFGLQEMTFFSLLSEGSFPRELSKQLLHFLVLGATFLATFAGGYILMKLPKNKWEKTT